MKKFATVERSSLQWAIDICNLPRSHHEATQYSPEMLSDRLLHLAGRALRLLEDGLEMEHGRIKITKIQETYQTDETQLKSYQKVRRTCSVRF